MQRDATCASQLRAACDPVRASDAPARRTGVRAGCSARRPPRGSCLATRPHGTSAGTVRVAERVAAAAGPSRHLAGTEPCRKRCATFVSGVVRGACSAGGARRVRWSSVARGCRRERGASDADHTPRTLHSGRRLGRSDSRAGGSQTARSRAGGSRPCGYGVRTRTLRRPRPMPSRSVVSDGVCVCVCVCVDREHVLLGDENGGGPAASVRVRFAVVSAAGKVSCWWRGLSHCRVSCPWRHGSVGVRRPVIGVSASIDASGAATHRRPATRCSAPAASDGSVARRATGPGAHIPPR